MTVAELVRSLQSLGIEKQNLPVIIRGYEGGSNEVSEITPTQVAWDHHADMPYYGRHQIVSADEYEWLPDAEPTLVLTEVIHLVGHNR